MGNVNFASAVQDTNERDERLKELILYIAKESEGDPNFGATKLNKLLFFADFLAYLNLGKPITGQEYMRIDHGPVPRRMKPVCTQLLEQGHIAIREETLGEFERKRTMALRQPNLKPFTGEEISIVETVLRKYEWMNATQISNESHAFHGWKLAGHKDHIPYWSALVGTRKPTSRESSYAREIQRRIRNREQN